MKKYFLIGVSIVIAATSCRKDPDFDDLSSDLIVSTNVDPTAQFNTYETFYISDTVANLGGTDEDSILTGPSAQQLVESVRANMVARGYTVTNIRRQADLGIQIGIVKVLNIESYYYPGWWGGYYGWYDPWYWGSYYPYYYGWSTTYVYNTGTLIVDMYDLKNAAINQQYKAVWNITSLGIIGDSLDANVQRGINAVDQAFAQSEYLSTN
ncbi:DUF4136 domain-containing protein [Flavihumibacter sp. R14]|nr:DUF4136 domain-containing protein [Flavihumibacter soli]